MNIPSIAPWLCIYHARCLDGFGAAWAVHDHFRATGRREHIRFHAAMHHTEPPPVAGMHVLLVDFCYPAALLARMAGEAASVTVIDHHVSVVRDLEAHRESLPTVTLHLDMAHSGAVLTWQHFNPGTETPVLLRYIQDRDLWAMALPDSRQVTAALFERPFRFEVWDGLVAGGEDTVRILKSEGALLVAKHDRDVERFVKNGTHRINCAGFDVPALNVPAMYASECGARLAKGEAFSVTYHHVQDKTLYSLRSEPDGQDVAMIAALFGGGGHARAAGFSLPFVAPDLASPPTTPIKQVQ